VEDHPFEYRTFEGTIPQGSYGAGEVIVWDEGTYTAPGTRGKKETEAAISSGLRKGRLTFVLSGKKLKGEFSLIKMRGREENAWLLVKKDDKYASTRDVTLEDRSVRTGRRVEELKTNGKRKKEALRPVRDSRGKKEKAGKLKQRLAALLKKAQKGEMPHKVRPMLATLGGDAFDRKEWLFEIKWDGYRAIAEVSKGNVELYSRNLHSFNTQYQTIVEALKTLSVSAVLDGEIVIVDEEGKSHFQLLQNYSRTGKGTLLYYVFDILWLEGHDLTELPLRVRKEILKEVLEGADERIRYSDHVEEKGLSFFYAAVRKNLEGLLAKDGSSPYEKGVRTKKWLKIRTHHRQEAVIAGFTKPRGSRTYLGALVLGVYEGAKLVYIGHTGTGMDEVCRKDLHEKLLNLKIGVSPFPAKPKTNAPVTWVRPELVCEIEFTEWTKEGQMRHPVFVGLREDKTADSVVRELPEKEKAGKDRKKTRVGKRTLSFTNLSKIFWPEEKYTKGDLISYYEKVAPFILPYLKDRPHSLHRHPDGIAGKSFYQKDVSDIAPPWLHTKTFRAESEAREVTYLVGKDAATLLYMVNLGCIEINPWSSRVMRPKHPDWLVIDLDPDEVDFYDVVRTAHAVREVLEDAGLESYCKTSGKTGLHIYVPLAARYSYDKVRAFGEIVASLVHAKLPDITSIERGVAKRKQRVYVDYLQNSFGQTLAAPYSVRPWPGVTVSCPLRWKEVNKDLNPQHFTVKTIFARLGNYGDLFAPVLGKGGDMKKALLALERAPARAR
jgi:bifunctional non-homologous end joining protein LigD